jgi:ATP-dependent Lon protease
MSKDNEKDLADVPEEVLEDLTVHTVDMIDEVLDIVLEDRVEEIVPAEEIPVWKTDVASTEISSTIE